MFKVFIVFLTIFVIDTIRSEVVFQDVKPIVNEPHFFNKDRNCVQLKYESVQYNGDEFPPDNEPNFGDAIYKERESNDTLIVRELIINEQIYDVDTPVVYSHTLKGWNITTVRAINIGRQRAYTTMVGLSNDGWVYVQAIIKHQEQIRLLIEAYALKIQH